MYLFDTAQLKIIRYRRKSTEDEDRQIASLPDQAVALDEVAARFHIHASQIAADFGESRSAKLSHTRPEFQRMAEMIERGDANAIVTWHPDRLSRNLGDVDTLIRLMEAGKLTAIITPQYMFGNTPLEKYILISECTRAKLENDNRGVNVKRGLKGKVRKGWRPGVAPVGYLNDLAKTKGERDLIPDPDRFDKIRHLLRLFLTGNFSVRELHRAANDRLLLRTRKTKRQGDRPLSISHVYRILTDPFYCGKFRWKNQETNKIELHVGKHRPMITEDEYWHIQALLGKKVRPQKKSHLFAYTAIMSCGECGSQITAEEKWQIICGECKLKFALPNKAACIRCGVKIADMRTKKVLHYVYYHCTKHKGPCSQKGVRVEALESEIDRALASVNITGEFLHWALDTLKSEAQADRVVDTRMNRDIVREQAALKEELAELNRFFIKQERSGWTLMSKEEALAEKHRLLAKLNKLNPETSKTDQRTDGLEETTHALEYACHARFWVKVATPEDKRELLGALGSNLVLENKKLKFDLAYPLTQIDEMIEIAPEIIPTFEPGKTLGTPTGGTPCSQNIPYLRGRLNAIRTYFQTSRQKFWTPKRDLFRAGTPRMDPHDPASMKDSSL